MDVHSYFSHFETPYDAFATYLDVLYDFKNHLILSCVLDKYTKQIQRLKLNLEKKSIVSNEDKDNNYTDENNNANENNTNNANSDDNHNTNNNNKNGIINSEIVETAHNNEYSKNLKNKHHNDNNDILQKRIDDVLLKDKKEKKEKKDKHKDDLIIGS
jgi:alpha-amylase